MDATSKLIQNCAAVVQVPVSEFKQRVTAEAITIVDCLVNGGGECKGLGETLDRGMSMTDATECYWGTSGRGNQNAKSCIRGAANLGYVRVQKRGRNEVVGLTAKGLEAYRAAKADGTLPSTPTTI